jgi:single-strand DNA-binding protein
VEGRLKYGKYVGQDGIERNTTDIIATELQLLGGREGGAVSGGGDEGYDSAPPAPAAPARRPAATARPPVARPPAPTPAAPAKSSSGFDDMDDDIPF